MFGKNKILKPENSDGTTLKVTEIFNTFQGEGPYAGYSATFVRLGGCNLACDFCDTEFDEFEKISLDKIITHIKKSKQEMVVITGGEPMRQNITPLCQELTNLGILTQIETNGTIFRELPDETKIICSPKISQGKYHPIRPDLLAHINAFKFIISAHKQGYKDLPDFARDDSQHTGRNLSLTPKMTGGKFKITEKQKIPIYLQPMDEYNATKNAANQKLALELAQKYQARISLQMHKILGIA